MGMMQRCKRYNLEREQPAKRGKVYEDGQALWSARVRLALAGAQYMAAMMQIMAKIRAIREMARPKPMSVEPQHITLTRLPIDDARAENLMASLTQAAKAAGGHVVAVGKNHTAS